MEYKIDDNGNISVPADLFIDVAITLDKLKDKFNCDDGQLKQYGLDWWYFHKLQNRVQYIIDNIKPINNT